MMDESQKFCTLELIVVRMEELERRMELHRTYQERALVTADSDLRDRLKGMNEFRDQLREQAKSFVTQANYEERHRRIADKIDALSKEMEERSNRHAVKDDATARELDQKIDGVKEFVSEGLGARVTSLELAKSNLEGRFWALAAVMVLIEVGIQLWAKLHT